MKKMKRSFTENFQLTVFSVTYLFSSILLFWLLCLVLKSFQPVIIVLAALVYFLMVILLWSYLYVLFSIPQRLARNFDRIKNDIASGKIISPEEFANRLCSFLVGFYNYSFFDIEMASVKIIDNKPCFSSQEMKECFDWDELEKEVMKIGEQIIHEKIQARNFKYFSYTTPILFGDEYLGFFTALTSRRLGKLMLKMLADLENDFIDDQLAHVLGKENPIK